MRAQVKAQALPKPQSRWRYQHLAGSIPRAVGALLLMLAGVGVAASGAQATPLQLATDQASELRLAPPPPLPQLGPRYAAVTVDLYLPLGHKLSEPTLQLALLVQREASDVRLVVHPQASTPIGRVAAELLAEAYELKPDRCFELLALLHAHPDWVEPGEKLSSTLAAAVTALDLPPAQLEQALSSRRHRGKVVLQWENERLLAPYPPELRLNGQRVAASGLTYVQLREELDRQRTRAYRALASGTPPTQLFERLHSEAVAANPQSSSLYSQPFSTRTWGRFPLPARSATALATTTPAPAPLERRLRLDLSVSPSRGPQVAPVTIVFIGSLDLYAGLLPARAALAAARKYPDRVRLVFMAAPRIDSSQRIATLLQQVWQLDPGRYWNLVDTVLELTQRRYFLRLDEVEAQIQPAANLAILRNMLRSSYAQSQVERQQTEARRIGLEYTPLVLVNGVPIRGALLAENVLRATEKELERGLLARLRAKSSTTDYSWLTR
jgi:protein-disulfide isomerase